MTLTTQLGQGGAGFQGTGKESAAYALLNGTQVSLVTGGAANAKLALADIEPGDKLISVINNNAGVLTDVTATTTIASKTATGTVTVGTAAKDDTVAIAGFVYTLTDTKPADSDYSKVLIGSTATITAASLAAAINAREATRQSKVSATAAAAVVTITATPGAAGNALALVETGSSFTVSGATLSGGSDTGGIKVTTATDQLQVVWQKA